MITLGSIARVHMAKEEVDQALVMFQTSLTQNREVGDKTEIATDLEGIADFRKRVEAEYFRVRLEDFADHVPGVADTIAIAGMSILTRTNFSTSGLDGAKFSGVKLTDVKFNQTDLRKTTFESCSFHGVDFNQCDLRGVCFDGLTFIGVKFDQAALNEASFKGATLKNVSFHSPFTWLSWSKKYYRAIKTICFDGATMDKLTYAALKGMEADLSKVTVK